MYFLKKNEATEIIFPMLTTANPETFDTGETVTDTGYYKDGAGAWTTLAITDTVSEIGSTGMYEISLTAGEMNHDWVAIKFTSTNAADQMVLIKTYAVDQDDLVRATTPANTLDVNATGEAGIDLDNTSGTLAKTTDITGFNDPTASAIVDEWESQSQTDPTGFHVNVQEIGGTAQTANDNGADINEILLDVTGINGDAMRGTDNAALASVLGALTDAAAAGDPTTVDTLMQYIKQLINILVGTAGVATFPSEAAPGNAVSLAEVIRAVHADVTGLNGDVMRGTDSAALASVATEARLSELDAATAGKAANQIDEIRTDTEDIQGRLPASLVTGRMDSDVGAMQAGTVSAAAIGTGAIDADALATDAVDEIRDGLLPTQNSAFNNIPFLFVAASDHVTPVTGASGMAVTRSIDGGSFGSGTGTGPAEISNGIYQYDASAADMNGGVIVFRFTATGGTPGAPDDRFVTIITGGGV